MEKQKNEHPKRFAPVTDEKSARSIMLGMKFAEIVYFRKDDVLPSTLRTTASQLKADGKGIWGVNTSVNVDYSAVVRVQ